MEDRDANALAVADSDGHPPATGLRPLAPVLLSKQEMAVYEDEFDFAFGEDR